MTEKKSIHQAIVAVQAEVESVARGAAGQVGNQKFNYADLAGVIEMIQPIKAKHGLALIQYVKGDALVGKIVHESGAEMEAGEYALGAFTKGQDRGKEITYGRRYQECAIWGIAQEEDPDKAQAVWGSKRARGNYTLLTVNKIDNAQSMEDLNLLWKGEGAKINEMARSTNGDDQSAAQEIFSALRRMKAKIMKTEDDDELLKELNRRADNGNFDGAAE